MTKREFIERYARKSNISVEALLEHMDAYLCDCEDALCLGWQMLSPESAKIYRHFGRIPKGDDDGLDEDKGTV